MDEFEAMIDGLDERTFRAMTEFMLGGRRGKGEQRSAAARAFGVTEGDLDMIRRMPGATWTEDEYRSIAGDAFAGIRDDPFATCRGFHRKK